MSKDKFLNSVSLLDREAYEYYRQHRLRTAPGLNDYNLYKKAVSGLFSLLTRMMQEAEGGIYIENLGYFCYLVSPKPRLPIKSKKSIILRNIKYYIYYPYFFPDKQLEGFTAYKTFGIKPTTVKRKLHFDICESKREGYLAARIHKKLSNENK